MKIAIIQMDLPGDSKGGVAYVAHNLANKLVSKGHNIVIFTTSPKPNDGIYKICQIKLPGFIKRIYVLKTIIFPVMLLFKDFSLFDILHSHGDEQLIFTTTPTIRTFHGSALDEAFNATTIFRFILQFFYTYPLEVLGGLKTDMNIAVSKGIRKRYLFNMRVIYNGVDMNIFKPGLKSQHPVILYIGGTLRGRKRGRMLVRIFDRQIRKVFPKAELWLVSREAAKGENIRCFTANLKPEEIAQLYQKAWLLCLPSRYEGFGLPYIEAMASGLTIVTTPNSGAEEILEYGKYGHIIHEKYLADSVIELLKNEKKRRSYEKAGIERAKEFSTEIALNRYQQAYKKLYAQSRK